MSNIKEYLQRHIDKKEVKRVSRQYILSNGLQVTIDDYSATGNDDTFYDKYGYDTLLRRGTTCVQVNGREQWYFGLPKFGYDTPETKQGNAIWYFTEKENGECGHVAFVDHQHILIGSKNVHIVLGLTTYDHDLEMYHSLGEVRLEYALRIACLLKSQHWNECLIEYMVRNNMVMILEALFNTHIVFYDKEGYRVTAFVQDGEVLSPTITFQLCKLYQLPIVKTVVANNEQEYEHCCKLFTQSERDSEGAVIYKETNEGVRLFKLKHPVYVAKRAARELIKRRASKQQWEDRMKNLHVQVNEELLHTLYKFYLWLLHTMPKYTADTVQDQFAILWKGFHDAGCPSLEDIVKDERNTQVNVIGFVGIPGCGKSTLSKALEQCLTANGVPVTRINQDELCKNRKQFLSRLQQLSKSQNDGYILVDKVNHTQFLRKDIDLVFTRVTWVVFDSGEENMVDVCLNRIRERGIYHPSLVYSYKAKEVLERFYEEMQMPTGDNVLRVNMKDTIIEQLSSLAASFGLEIGSSTLAEPKCVTTLPSILYWKIDLPDGKHVTLVYQPTREENLGLLPHFGKEIEVCVEYILRTDRVHVAGVRKTPFLETYCKNVYPHITLWTADGVKPFEANATFTSTTAVRECVEYTYKGIVTVELR